MHTQGKWSIVTVGIKVKPMLPYTEKLSVRSVVRSHLEKQVSQFFRMFNWDFESGMTSREHHFPVAVNMRKHLVIMRREEAEVECMGRVLRMK